MTFLLKQSATFEMPVFMVDSADHVTGKTGLTLTVTASKNGAAFASISPTVTERGNGWYFLSLTTAHTSTVGALCLHVTSSGADPSDLSAQVGPVDANAIEWLGVTIDTPADPGIPNVNVVTMASNSLTSNAVEDNAFSNFKFDSSFYAAAADADANAVWDATTASHVTAGTFGKALQDITATAIRDAILNFEYRTGRTVRGLFRRLGASIEKATGLLGSTATFFQPDGVTEEFHVTQDTANGTRTNPVVTNSETP